MYNFLHLIIVLPLYLCLDMSQLDIKSAFFNSNLNEEVWMMPLPSISLDRNILYLRKSLYRLKQALLAWFEKLSSILIELCFLSSLFNLCIFISSHYNIIIIVYVDDIIIVERKSDIYKVY